MSQEAEQPQTLRERAKAAYNAATQRASEITTGVVTSAQDLATRASEVAAKVQAKVESGVDRAVEGIVTSAEVPARTLYDTYDHTRQMLTGRTLTQELQLTEAQKELLLKYLAAEILTQVHGPAVDSLVSRARAALPPVENPQHLPAVRDRRGVQPETAVAAFELLSKGLLNMAVKRFEDRMIAAPGQEDTMHTAALRDVARGLVGVTVNGVSNMTSFNDLPKLAGQHASDINGIVANFQAAKAK